MAASYVLVAATTIFLVTYVLISLRTIGRVPLERPAVAMLGGALMLLFGVLTPGDAIAAINVDVLLLLVGMMVLVSGLSAAIQDAFSSGFGGASGGLVWLTALSALLSNLISNVPAVLLLAEVVPQTSTQLWLALAASSTLAGNATILGAACNVIVVQIAARDGVDVSMKQFVRAGLPVTAVTLVLATVLIAFLVSA